MDCVIAGDSVRPFCAAIGCLSRMQNKEIYLDFDPIDGLTMRALNDAKSVFASFHYDPTFFQQCTAPPAALSKKNHSKKTYSSSTPSTSFLNRKRNRKERKGHQGRRFKHTNDVGEDNDDSLDEEEEDERLSIRVPVKALSAVVKKRSHPIVALRIQSTRTQHDDNGDSRSHSGQHSSVIASYNALSFEFQFQPITPPNGNSAPAIIRVVHQIGVADAKAVAAVAPTDGASELVVSPNVLLRMLEPLRRTTELALIVSDEHKLISACTFHHDDVMQHQRNRGEENENNENHVNNLFFASKPASLKTETSIACDDLIDYDYISHHNEEDDDGDDDDTGRNHPSLVRPPDDLSSRCVLVFNIKEFKALLQFCSHAHVDQELRVTINFFWGGRPMVVETEWEGCFSAQLVMATLNHNLLGGMAQRQSAVAENAPPTSTNRPVGTTGIGGDRNET